MPPFQKGNKFGAAGRPKGVKAIPPGTVKSAYTEFIDRFRGHELMVEAIESGLKRKGKLALSYMELAAKVLDRTDQNEGPVVQIVFKSPLDKGKLKVGKGSQ